MKKLLYLLSLLLAVAIALCSCGGSDDGNKEIEEPVIDPETHTDEASVPRVKNYVDDDGVWHIFLKMGQMVKANVNFKKALLDSALTHTSWKLDYCFVYDDKLISDSLTFYYPYLPIQINKDSTVLSWQSLFERKYTVDKKTIHVQQSLLSSSMNFASDFVVLAVDYTNDIKRLVIEGYPFDVRIPKEFSKLSCRLRMVWSPL